MTSKRVPITHGWCKISVRCQAFVGTLLGSRALRRHLWSVAAEQRAWHSHADLRPRATRRAPLTVNQLNPGFRAIPSQTRCGAMPPQQTTGSTPAVTDQTNRNSGIVSDTQAIASSQGVFNRACRDITPTPCPNDQPFLGTLCDQAPVNPTGNGVLFHPSASPLTQVRNGEPRNTPSNIRRHTHAIPYTVGLLTSRSPPEKAARTHGTTFPWVRIA